MNQTCIRVNDGTLLLSARNEQQSHKRKRGDSSDSRTTPITAHPEVGRPTPRSRITQGRYRSGSFEIDPCAATQRCRDVDQRVERETRDPAAEQIPATEQIIDPWLRYATASCRFLLCPVILFEACGDLLHQFGRALRFAACSGVSAIASQTLA